MAILILNRNLHSFTPYEEWLDSNELVMLTSSDSYDSFLPVNDRYDYIESFNRFGANGNVERRAMELHSHYRFSAIIAVAEYDLIRAAELREALGIEGQYLESATAYRNKYIMKQIVKESGVKVPAFARVRTNMDLIHFASTHSLPLVVKVVDGSGAEGVSIIRDNSDLIERLQKGFQGEWIVEEFVPGVVYHVDGLYQDGRILFSWPSVYINDCLAYIDGSPSGSYILEVGNTLVARLQQVVQQSIDALPSPRIMAFHAEIFHTPNDELVFCEIASRVGGSKIGDMINSAFDFNLMESWLRLQCQLNLNRSVPNKPVNIVGNVLVHPKKGMFIQAPKVPIPFKAIEYEILAEPGQSFDYGNHCNDCLASFVIEGDSEEETRVKLQECVEWFTSNMVWDSSLFF